MHILGAGAVIGDDEIINRSKYTQTLGCLSKKGTLYEISKENIKFFE